MGWLDKPIQEGVRRGVDKAMKEAFGPKGSATKIIRDTLGMDLPNDAPMNRAQFVFAMAQRFAREGIQPADEVRRYAIATLAAFLADNKIKFGDTGYRWDRTCAVLGRKRHRRTARVGTTYERGRALGDARC